MKNIIITVVLALFLFFVFAAVFDYGLFLQRGKLWECNRACVNEEKVLFSATDGFCGCGTVNVFWAVLLAVFLGFVFFIAFFPHNVRLFFPLFLLTPFYFGFLRGLALPFSPYLLTLPLLVIGFLVVGKERGSLCDVGGLFGEPVVRFFLLFVGLVGLSVVFAMDKLRALKFFVAFVFLAVPAFFMPAFFCFRKSWLRDFLLFVVLSVVAFFSVVFFVSRFLLEIDFFSFVSLYLVSRNVVGLFFGLAAIIFFWFFLLSKKKSVVLLCGSGALLFSFLLFAIKTVGVVLSFGTTLLVLFFLRFDSISWKRVFWFVVVVLVLSMFFVVPFAAWFFGADESVSLRLGYYKSAVDIGLGNPLGIGTGSFAVISKTGAVYPHNLFFETFVEIGVFGLLVLLVFLFFVLKTFFEKRERASPLFVLFVLIALYGFVEAQFSFNLAHQILLWFGCGMIVFWRQEK